MSVYLLILLFITIAIGMVLSLLKSDKGAKEPVSALWLAAGFGLSAAVVASIFEKAFISLSDLKVGAPVGVLLTSFLSIGFIEELLKFMPLAIFIYPKRYFNEHTDGIIYFAVAGLAFGLPENILYTVSYGAKAGVARLILTPFFHAAITSMVGYYFIKNKLAHKNIFKTLPILLLAVVLHSFYDFGLSSGSNLFIFISVTITLALSINFFNLFFRAKDKDEDTGLASVDNNNFCKSCGHKNNKHYLYCTQCGQRA